MNVSVDATGLKSGVYTDIITISAFNTISSPQIIPVILKINDLPLQPILHVEPNQLSFSATIGESELPTKTMVERNE